MLILNLLAIGFSISKIVTSVITKKIKDGIQLVYISDIFYDYVSSFVIFIDFAYLIMLIVFLVDGNFLSIFRKQQHRFWSKLIFNVPHQTDQLV